MQKMGQNVILAIRQRMFISGLTLKKTHEHTNRIAWRAHPCAKICINLARNVDITGENLSIQVKYGRRLTNIQGLR